MDKRIVYVSPSSLAAYENCPRSYLLERVLKVRTVQTNASIGFGTSTGRGVELFLRGMLQGRTVDPVAIFRQEWRRFLAMHAVRYTKGATAESLEAIGCRLMEQFPDAWSESGYKVVLDARGEPMIERKLKIDVGDNVVLVTKLDVMVETPEGKTAVVDYKATASSSSLEFTMLSDQLTSYNLATDAHAPLLGIRRPELVGYWEMLRRNVPKTNRGEGPVILKPMIVPRRSDTQFAQFVGKCHQLADRIRAEEFGPTPRMSFNSPCDSCSLSRLCARGETDGLVFRDPQAKSAALAIAA